MSRTFLCRTFTESFSKTDDRRAKNKQEYEGHHLNIQKSLCFFFTPIFNSEHRYHDNTYFLNMSEEYINACLCACDYLKETI